MKVEYISHMGDDLTVVNAARVSFDKQSQWEDKYLSVRDTKLIEYLAKHNHFSPFTHPQISLRITAPIFVARQLFRHRIGLEINEVSRRYVDDPPEFYIPSEWRERAKNAKQGSGDTHPLSKNCLLGYERILAEIESQYDWMIENGICPEQARMILPQSMYTSWYWTGSLYAFIRVCQLRLESHTQQETQEVASMIRDIIQPLYPSSWGAFFDGYLTET